MIMSQTFPIEKFFAQKLLQKINWKRWKFIGQIVKVDQHQCGPILVEWVQNRTLLMN